MSKWILIVGLALAAILGFLLVQGPLSLGPTEPPESETEQPAEESEQPEQSEATEQPDDTDEDASSETESPQPSEQAREIMRQAREAQGGLDALQNLNGYHVQASSITQQQGQTFSLETETWVQMPNQLRQATTVNVQDQTIESLTVWNGQRGWVRQQGQVQELQPNQAGSVQQSLYFDPLHILLYTAQESFSYSYEGTETVDGTETHVIRVRTPQDQSVNFYFDTEDFLPVQRSRSAQGSTVRTVFRDYQRVNGFAFAFTQQTYLDDSLAQEQTVESVEVNPSFEPQLFQEPQTEGQQSGQ